MSLNVSNVGACQVCVYTVRLVQFLVSVRNVHVQFGSHPSSNILNCKTNVGIKPKKALSLDQTRTSVTEAESKTVTLGNKICRSSATVVLVCPAHVS